MNKLLDRMNAKKAYGIGTAIALVLQGVAVALLNGLMFSALSSTKKQYQVSGALLTYLGRLFSDPRFILLLAVPLLFWIGTLVLNVRGIVTKERGALLLLILLIIGLGVFCFLVCRIVFV